MNLRKYWIMNLGLAALALGATVSRAAANEVYKGTFTLSSEAYWGDTLLEPGEYTIVMDADLTKTPLVQLRGNGVNAVVMALPVSRDLPSMRSHLTLAQFNGAYAVRELDAGPLGQTFHFGVSKQVRGAAERAATAAPVHVPISAANRF